MFALVLLAVVLVAASAQPDCPNPVTECETDPCEEATCPRFLTADCQANLCHGGLCTANFLWRGRNVTDRCSVRMCDEVECPGKRVCVEEVTPSSCPEGRPKCRQFINARCALPRPITDCNLLECPEGMVCRDRIRGEGVVCAIPRNCRQIECNEGLECVVLNRRAQCVTIPTTPAPPVTVTPNVTDETPSPVTSSGMAPESCDELECPRGQGCIVLNGRPTCSQFQPTCETLDCSEIGFCSSITTPSQDLSVSLCVNQAAVDAFRALVPCSEQNLCDPDAELCVDSKLEDGSFVRSFCISTGCINDTQCAFDETCLTVPPSVGIPVASVCVPTGGEFEFGPDCSTISKMCPNSTACNDIQSDGMTVGTICFLDEVPQLARTCDELDCESQFPGGGCVLQSIEYEAQLQVAQCFAEDVVSSIVFAIRVVNGLPLFPPTTSSPITSSGIPTMPPESCDELECPRGQGCIETSFGVAFCSPFQPSCATLDCSEIGLCLTQGFPSQDLFLASCVAQSVADVFRSITPCAEQNFCDTDELCVDSRLPVSTFLSSFCISTSCNDDTECAADESCLSVPPSVGIPVTSVCVPTDGDFEFGPGCTTSGRECPNGTVCSNILSEGEAVGTICGEAFGEPPPPFSRSCDTIDCESQFPGGDCALQFLDSGESLALCLSEEDVAANVIGIRNALAMF